MTDETTHLRALLADATARAERAERTLTEALTRLPSTWGPPEVLRHLLDKAGRCDQAEVRAEHAERENEKLVARLEGCLARGTAEETRANAALAACAEMRAALERMIKYAVEVRAPPPRFARPFLRAAAPLVHCPQGSPSSSPLVWPSPSESSPKMSDQAALWLELFLAVRQSRPKETSAATAVFSCVWQ